jgi:hypothetical protein
MPRKGELNFGGFETAALLPRVGESRSLRNDLRFNPFDLRGAAVRAAKEAVE